MRSTAKAGITTVPPRFAVRTIASASRSVRSVSGWLVSPYVDSTTSASAAGGGSGGESSGCSWRPRSPLNTTVGPPATRTTTLDAPRMCPAVRSSTSTPSATRCGLPNPMRRKPSSDRTASSSV